MTSAPLNCSLILLFRVLFVKLQNAPRELKSRIIPIIFVRASHSLQNVVLLHYLRVLT